MIISLRATSDFTTGFSIAHAKPFFSSTQQRTVYFQVRRDGSNIQYRNPRTKLLTFPSTGTGNITGEDSPYTLIRVRNI